MNDKPATIDNRQMVKALIRGMELAVSLLKRVLKGERI